MKIPVIVERSNSNSDAASQNESEAASGESSGESGDEADVEDSNDSETPLSLTRDDLGKRKNEHPLHLSIAVSNGGGASSSRSGSSDGGSAGRLRLPDSEGEGSSYHSASVERERTRLREEGKENVGKEEKDALRILGMVRISSLSLSLSSNSYIVHTVLIVFHNVHVHTACFSMMFAEIL